MNNTPPCEQGRDSSVLRCSSDSHDLPSTQNTGIEPGRKRKTYAHLRPVPDRGGLSDTPALRQRANHSESIFSAELPLGTAVRPVSISLTDEAAKSTSSPTSERVKPVLRKSRIFEAQVVMQPSLRHAVELSQRQPVTVFRDNMDMPRPLDLPRFSALGPRVKWWREHRGMDRKELAKKAGLGYSTLSDLENDEQKSTKQLHLIASVLQLNPHYLETDRGEPEANVPPPPPEEVFWPFEAVPVDTLGRLDPIERNFVETKLLGALQEIEAVRRKRRRG